MWSRSVIFILLGLLFHPAGAQRKGLTFSQFKKIYLNQRVVIRDMVMPTGLISWRFVRNANSAAYEEDPERHVGSTYLGQRGTVLAITLDGPTSSSSGMDVFGEPITRDEVVNSTVVVVVKLDTGELLLARTYTNAVSILLETENSKSSRDEYIEANLPTCIGKKLYPVAQSELYDADSSLDELVGLASRRTKRATSFQRLVPITVVSAKYFSAPGIVLLKLKADGASTYIAVGGRQIPIVELGRDRPLIQALETSLYDVIPETLTAREVASIKDGSLFRGESRDALVDTLGFPQKENDWGAGGKQLVYNSIIIYIDTQKKLSGLAANGSQQQQLGVHAWPQ